jgi:hypothetical protein
VASDGTGPKFRLRAWRRLGEAAEIRMHDDRASLRARGDQLVSQGFARADLEAWNLELNDWVRLERLPPD